MRLAKLWPMRKILSAWMVPSSNMHATYVQRSLIISSRVKNRDVQLRNIQRAFPPLYNTLSSYTCVRKCATSCGWTRPCTWSSSTTSIRLQNREGVFLFLWRMSLSGLPTVCHDINSRYCNTAIVRCLMLKFWSFVILIFCEILFLY